VKRFKAFLITLSLVILFLTPLIVAKSTTIDIFALPKSTFFVTGILLVSILLGLSPRIFKDLSRDRVSQVLLALALFVPLISLLLNGFNEERIFGVHGRFNGALTYMALFLLILIIRATFDLSAIRKSLLIGALANLIVGTYFLLQVAGKDFTEWQQIYGDPSSTLGNPNFVSGFLATTTFCYLALFQNNSKLLKLNRFLQFVSILGIGFSITCIVLTSSSLGLLSVLFGFLFILISIFLKRIAIFRKMSNTHRLVFALSLFIFIPLSAVILTFNLFSLASSITNRLYYWQVSLTALMSKPLQGFGFDSTGDFFRTVDRQDRFGATFAVDSAHNLVIDLATWVGLPVIVIILSLLVLTLIKFLRLILNSTLVLSTEMILFLSFLSFITQALISVPIIGVNAWGFCFLGSLITLAFPKASNKGVSHMKIGVLRASQSLLVLILILLLPLFPMRFMKDIDFRTFSESGDGLRLINLVQQWPEDSFHYLTLTHSLYLNNQSSLARSIGKQGLEFNSRNYLLLDEMMRQERELSEKSQDPNFNSALRREIQARMDAINPLYKLSP
jgi:O-antigen ligase